MQNTSAARSLGFAWEDANRTDIFARAAGGQTVIVAVDSCHMPSQRLDGVDNGYESSDAYLMCPQPRVVKIDREKSEYIKFLQRVRGLTTVPIYEEAEGPWLPEVACDSDWSGNKRSHSSTSLGNMFLGRNWAGAQKHIALSSTESGYVTLSVRCVRRIASENGS